MLNIVVPAAMALLGIALLLNAWRLFRGLDATDHMLPSIPCTSMPRR